MAISLQASSQSLFRGFIPDENGINLDDLQAKKGASKVATVTFVKDCAACPEMVVIPAGSFVMGSGKYSTEQPSHAVKFRSFLIGKTEVTQELWESVMGNNPSFSKGQTLPVETVSWDDIQRFIVKLNQKSRQKYRLPSEAEWEYAARAGSSTEWSFGDDEAKVRDYAWYSKNSGGRTYDVGQKLPNAFGLFDMHGNVAEWAEDCWHERYEGIFSKPPTDGSAWISDCSGNTRVIRGGSFNSFPENLRSAYRNRINAINWDNNIGFRLARDL